MQAVTLEEIFTHPITQKYLQRSGIYHAISVAEYAFSYAKECNVDPEMAAKAGLLHDIGHYKWYHNGRWDFEQYRENDIHAIKGANRAHKLLVRIGENRHAAKQIALAILLHTDSYLPDNHLERTPLQHVVAQADEADEEPGGRHHYKLIDADTALKRMRKLDERIQQNEFVVENV